MDNLRVTGGIAQLGERVLCKHEVVGSIPSASTNYLNFYEKQDSVGALRGVSDGLIKSKGLALCLRRTYVLKQQIVVVIKQRSLTL